MERGMPVSIINNHDHLCQLCVKLAESECSYCQNGNCLETDRPCRERLINPKYSIQDGAIDCDWFWEAVLPLNRELNESCCRSVNETPDLWDEDPEKDDSLLRQCVDCGRIFTPHSNSQKRCRECAVKAKRKTDAAAQRRYYWRMK